MLGLDPAHLHDKLHMGTGVRLFCLLHISNLLGPCYVYISGMDTLTP